jgi:hypothetical protein
MQQQNLTLNGCGNAPGNLVIFPWAQAGVLTVSWSAIWPNPKLNLWCWLLLNNKGIL